LKKAVKQSLKFSAFLLLGLLLLYLAFRKTDTGELRNALTHADYRWLLVSFAVSIAAFLSRARRWMLLIRPLGFQPGHKTVYHSLMSGYLANMALPRMGEVTRCVMLNRKEKIPLDKLIGTVILERVIDFISLILILVVTLLVSYNTIGPFLKNSVAIPLGEKITLLFGSTLAARAISISILSATLALLFIFRKKILGETFYPKIREFISGVMHGFRSFTTIERKWEFLLHSGFIWLCYIVMTWVIVFVLPATSHLGFADGVFLLVIGGLAMAAPVQSGLGAFHYIISRGLNIVYEIDLTDGLAYALISHTSQMFLIALLGSISLIILLSTGSRHKRINR
jgi:glycosyltransferase 2 family protein